MQIPGMEDIIRLALLEDIGGGDVTSLSTVPEANASRGKLIAKEPLTVCGLPAFERVFELIDPRIVVAPLVSDGDQVKKGDVIMLLEAMKMQNEIGAPAAGVVKSINIAAGESVKPGQVLAVIKG